jgi:hypothetical protein
MSGSRRGHGRGARETGTQVARLSNDTRQRTPATGDGRMQHRAAAVDVKGKEFDEYSGTSHIDCDACRLRNE